MGDYNYLASLNFIHTTRLIMVEQNHNVILFYYCIYQVQNFGSPEFYPAIDNGYGGYKVLIRC